VKSRPANKHKLWIYHEVTGSAVPRSCTVNASVGPVGRNHTQIREAKAEPEEREDDRLDIASFPDTQLTETDQPMEWEPTPQRYQETISTLRPSTRQRTLPQDSERELRTKKELTRGDLSK